MGMVINRSLSADTALQRGAGRKKRACWYNAIRNLIGLPSLQDGFYVEGFVLTPAGRIIEHGWVECDGQIIDTTPSYYEQDYSNLYFLARRFTQREASGLIGTTLPATRPFDDPAAMSVLQSVERFRFERMAGTV